MLRIRALTMPADAEEPGRTGEEFRAFWALSRRWTDDRFGPGIVASSPPEFLVGHTSSRAEGVAALGAFEQDVLVGAGVMWLPLSESTTTADTAVRADPRLDEPGRIAVIEALTDAVLADAHARGRTTVMAGSPASARGPLLAATGFGGVDPAEPEASALLRRGFALQQVYRLGTLELAEAPAPGVAPAGYTLLSWDGPTPAPHRPGMRALLEAMSTDAPLGGLAWEPESWDEARLAELEARSLAGGRTILTAAARHDDTGELAGFSTLFVRPDSVEAKQHDTVVAASHRGHGLGIALKREAQARLAAHPHVTRVMTFNAEENRPMLGVNEALGYRPRAYEGVWQRREPPA